MSSPLERQCRRIIAAELRSYDSLSRVSRIKYEQASQSSIDDGLFASTTFSCRHDVSLLQPCSKCQRGADEIKEYQKLASQRIKELLAKLRLDTDVKP